MKRLATSFALLLLASLAPVSARAESDLAKPIEAFCDDQTIFVSHTDITRIDVDSIAEFTRQFVEAMSPDDKNKEMTTAVNVTAATAGATIDRLRKGGVTHIYYILGLDEIMFSPGVIVVPMESPEKAKAAAELFAFALNKEPPIGELETFSATEVVGSTLLISNPSSLARAKSAKGKRPDIAEALDAVGDSSVHVVLTPSPTMWKVAAELLPTMPREIGGGSTEELLKGIRSVAIGFTPPIKPESGIDEPATKFDLRIRIPAEDEAAAKRAAKFLEAVKGEVIKLPDCAAYEPFANELFKILTPKIDKSGLAINVSKNDLLKLASTFSRPVAQAREKSKTVLATSNVRQMLISVQIYQHEHSEKWPASTKELIDGEIKLPETMLTSPLDGKLFVYRAPTEKELKEFRLSDLPVIWDAEGKDGLRIIGYADGHAEATSDKKFEEAFKKVGFKP